LDTPSQQAESSSSVATATPASSESIQQKDTIKELNVIEHQDDLDLDPELRSFSIVFGSLPASLLSESVSSPFVTLRFSKVMNVVLFYFGPNNQEFSIRRKLQVK